LKPRVSRAAVELGRDGIQSGLVELAQVAALGEALTKLADPATQLRPTATRVLKKVRADGPQTANELVSALARQGRAIRPATVETALGELAATGLAAVDGRGPARRWLPLVPPGDPLLDAVDLRGAHDFRHTFATWLEDAGIPARVVDELMGHEASTRGAQHLGRRSGHERGRVLDPA
jgi:integrase